MTLIFLEENSPKIPENIMERICGALCNLLPFVQFKKREKHPWRSVAFSKVACRCMQKPATLLKVTLLHGCFSQFLNCAHATKSRNAPHLLCIPNLLKLLVQNQIFQKAYIQDYF